MCFFVLVIHFGQSLLVLSVINLASIDSFHNLTSAGVALHAFSTVGSTKVMMGIQINLSLSLCFGKSLPMKKSGVFASFSIGGWVLPYYLSLMIRRRQVGIEVNLNCRFRLENCFGTSQYLIISSLNSQLT